MAVKDRVRAARDDGARATRRRGWTITVLFLLFMLINFADKAVTGLAGVEIKRDLGLSAEQFGLVQSSFFWLFAVGAVVVGGLCDRIRARWLVAGLMAVWCLSLLPLAAPIGLGMLMACRILLGFAEGPAAALANRVVHTWFPARERGLPSSVVITGAALGPLLAAPTLSWVIDAYSWHAAFLVLAAAGALWLVLWLLLGGEGPEGTAAEEPSGAESDRLPARVPYRTLLTSGTVLGLTALAFFSYMSTTLKVSWLPVYLEEGLAYDSRTAGLLVAFPYAAAVVLTLAVGWYSGRLVRRGVPSRLARGALSGALIAASGASMVLFTQLDRGWLQMAFLTLAFSLNTSAWGIVVAALSDVVPRAQRGTVLGAFIAVYSMGGVLAPMMLGGFVGSAATEADGYGTGFLVTGVAMLAGVLAALPFVDPERDARGFARFAADEGSDR
ncbi:MFS transporter [Actinomadura sp. WAC 06369]|uniref:MFS transporter n=1 Tax=Actinomadura sp. WAC 06369 TaxID=2203193 RepID=UPI000F7A704C|nr:MFS transporter [Actinomadura sp. WAC 06369]RSN59835.1 MFS transporter [Actinomadura sp. WAC 06369]